MTGHAPDQVRDAARGAYIDREGYGTREGHDAAADVAYTAGVAAGRRQAADAAVQADRERIRRNLSLPMLQAIRLIPAGRVQQGCIVSDGDVVRRNLRAAYFAITADQPAPLPLDLVEVAPWLELCGSCDAGLPQSCTCPPGDARVVIARLVDEIVMLRRELDQPTTGAAR